MHRETEFCILKVSIKVECPKCGKSLMFQGRKEYPLTFPNGFSVFADKLYSDITNTPEYLFTAIPKLRHLDCRKCKTSFDVKRSDITIDTAQCAHVKNYIST